MKKFIVALAAVALMASSAYAADWDFYGNARVHTFYDDADVNGGADGDAVLSEELQGNSRIGANVKVSDELTGRFEYGASDNKANIRHLYGEWNFGAGSLLVGQTYSPLNLFGSGQAYNDGGLEGYAGEMFGGREAQIKLTFGAFQIAFVAPDVQYYDYTTTRTFANGTIDTTTYSDKEDAEDNAAGPAYDADNDTLAHAGLTDGTDVTIPAIEVGYTLSGSNWDVVMVGGYQTFDLDQDDGEDVTSYGWGVDASMTFGALSVTGQVNGGQNVGNLWFIDVNGAGDAGGGYAAVVDDKVIDNDAIGARICAAYQVNDMFGLEIGYGMQETEYDVKGAEDDESSSYYINAPITLAPGVLVVPEVGVIDYEEEGETDTTYFGAKWQINF